MKCEILIGRGFEKILNMKPNMIPGIFSTQKRAIFLVFFIVFVALS